MPNKTPIKKTYISLVLVAVIGLGLSLIAHQYVKQWEHDNAIEALTKEADEHVRVLRQTFITFGNILTSLRGLHHVHHPITRPNFAQFVNDVLDQPGLQAWEWIDIVPKDQRQAVENKINASGIRDFSFWEWSSNSPSNRNKRTAAQREVYYPVLFTEPSNLNAKMLGYDVGSNETLKTALEKARDLGQLTTSGAVHVQTDTDVALGFYVFLPIYKSKTTPVTLAERRHELVGFAAGVFLFDQLVERVLRLPKLRTEVFLVIIDDTAPAQAPELYSPPWYRGAVRENSVMLWWTSLEFGGRQWRIVFYKSSDEPLFKTWYAWMVLGIGLLFTLGLLRYMYIILTHAQWAEGLVAKRTDSLIQANQALNKEIRAREQMTVALEASRQRFQAIFNEAAIGIAQIDLNDRILDTNRALQTLLRYREEELQDKFLKILAHPDDADIDQWMNEKMLAGKYDTYRVGKRYICKNGAIVWTNQSCSIVRDTTQPFIISMIEDITERKQAEEARWEAEKKYREIFENAIEGIFQCTPTGRYLSVNPAFVRMLGYESAEQIYNEITDIGQQLYVNPQRRTEFLNLLSSHSNVQDFEYQARCRDGRVIWLNETVRVVRDNNGQIRYYEGIVEDVTERKQAEEKLRHDATHDQLTRLLNRAAFTALLTKALARLHKKAQAESPATGKRDEEPAEKPAENHQEIRPFLLGTISFPLEFAVLFVDLDRFKIVNDSMGHLVGDQLLTEIARRLDSDACENEVVARFGGDEFALMLENIPDLSTLYQRIECIQQQLSRPYTLKNETFNTTASIGIALSNSEYSSADEILRDADTAMYEAKKQGRGKSVIFQPGMHTHVVNMLRMERDLRKALEREEFRLHYQPIISLETRQTVGLEALVRWEHPKQGMIRPDLFIPLAEESGLIKELGLWVFETACLQLRHWQTQFAHYAELGMNINVSPIQLKQPDLVNNIKDIIEKTGIKGSTCRVEITEGAMMQDPEAALTVLNELKSLEILLYIDDFGTGYSSLSYLQKFPIDALKIDKSFIMKIDSSGKSAQIAHAIIALGEAFDLRVVAEGVENDFQVSMLKKAHCHHVQGYFFSRPRDSQSIEEYLNLEATKIAQTSIH
jgi:diguanylate cyclase (GGDEF)-like protein/PAS domain S-box-containing protein